MQPIIIPNHWKNTEVIAKKIFDKFAKAVSEKEFFKWNPYKKFYIYEDEKHPVQVTIRHTKYWSCQCMDYFRYTDIRLNLSDEEIGPTGKNRFERLIMTVLNHELIHYFQKRFWLEKNLTRSQARYKELYGKGFNTDKNIFLYATNWAEMDAEVGTYCIMHNYQKPTYEGLLSYYDDWYNKAMSEAITHYVYEYMVEGNVRTCIQYRNRLFSGKERIEDNPAFIIA